MSRSGYSEDLEQWDLIRWRGAVKSAIRGKRGQAFLREMLAALDALPEKKLIRGDFRSEDGCVCALGSVAQARGMDFDALDPEDYPEEIAKQFGVSHALAAEVMEENDGGAWRTGTPQERFEHVRQWILRNLKEQP